ncbi:MAG: hypothetical protein ACE5Z5_05080 [Candidatus Bathyarchaeia archaeon]
MSETAKDVTEFLEEIWGHFSIGKYTKIFVDFAVAEKALYGLGERYRDHLIHVFNVFIMGLIIFSKILKQDKNIFELLKIQKEPNKVPFPSKYNEWRRLYYLWCLMSTFHDIATPIEHEEELLEVLNRFLGYFKIETERFSLKFPFMIQFDAGRYSDLMAKLFANGVVLADNAELPTYELLKEPTAASLYFRSVLTNAIDKRNHGVLGTYFLFRSIEDMFLSGKNPSLKYDLDVSAVSYENQLICLPEDKLRWDNVLKGHDLSEERFNSLLRVYDFNRDETKSYNDYVFEQDVTRAALAIALHNLDPNNDPKIFPIRFSKLPLSYLLILLDELQEFYRPEGIILTEVVRCHGFPQINVNVISLNKNKKCIQIAIGFDLKRLSKEEEKLIINRYNKLARSKDKGEVKTFEELVRTTWSDIFGTISRKLSFATEEPLGIFIKIAVEGRDPCGKELCFRSQNWINSA